LIAEEVAETNPGLIVRDRIGRPETVPYDQVTAMLLNEFLKEHKTVQDQGATIAGLQKQIKALTAGLQKLSAQGESSKATAQLALKDQQHRFQKNPKKAKNVDTVLEFPL
jgi:hypothetical protein